MRFFPARSYPRWLMTLLILPGLGFAEPDDTVLSTQSLKLSGFGTVAYAAAGNGELYFSRDLSQPTNEQTNNGYRADSRLGVQANFTINPDWEAVVQIVARYKAGPTLANSVEWGFLSYHPSTDSTIRVGRVGMDVFALSDYRNVGYAYNWVRPPTEFYGWIPLYSIDGADTSTNLDFLDTLVRPKFFVGSGKATIPIANGNYNFQAKDVVGTSILFERNAWRFRLSYEQLKVGTEFPFEGLDDALDAAAPIWPDATFYGDQLDVSGTAIRYSAAALNYDDGKWQVQSEFSHTASQSEFMPSGNRGYVSVGRRYNEWLPFVVYSRSTDPIHPNVAAPGGFGLEELAAETNYVLNENRLRQTTWSLGVRWDFASKMAWKLQMDRSKVSDPGSALWDIQSPTWSGGSRTVVSTSIDLIF